MNKPPPSPDGLAGNPQPGRLSYSEVINKRRDALKQQLAACVPASDPLVWEVGCGHGHFLTAYAAAHPTHVCLGIDIAGDRIERAQRKRDRAKLANLHFLRVEAGLFLDTITVEQRFARVFVLFPDPWPKLRHHKHRLMQPQFLTRLAGRMERGGRLFFRTDYAPYYLETEQVVAEHADWMIIDEAWPFEQETVFQQRAASHQSLVAGLRAGAAGGSPTS